MAVNSNAFHPFEDGFGGFWSEVDWDTTQGIMPQHWSASQSPQAMPHSLEFIGQELVASRQAYFALQPNYLARLNQFFASHAQFQSLWVAGKIVPSSFDHWVRYCLAPMQTDAEQEERTPNRPCVPLYYAHQYDHKTLQQWIRQLKDMDVSSGNTGSVVWVLSAAPLIKDPALARMVLSWLYPMPQSPSQLLARDEMTVRLKIVLIGSAGELERLGNRHPLWYEVSLQAHLPCRHLIDSQQALNDWMAYTQWLIQIHHPPNASTHLEASAWKRLVWLGQRHCDNGQMLPLEFDWAPHWVHLALTAQQPAAIDEPRKAQIITGETFGKTITQELSLKALAEKEALLELIQRQVFIKLQGQQVGSVYGVWVVSSSVGHQDFGMPFRMNCVVYKNRSSGDGSELGDLVDIEDKVSFSGPSQTKGTLIMQHYLARVLRLSHPLGLTAAFTTEQNYQKSDGDSGTLATLCCWVSALTQIPVRQSVVATGSMDLLGNVQPVGGINQKIEGVFACCKLQNFPEGAAMVIPASNQLQLLPNEEILAAVAAGKFSIIPVTCVEQALASMLVLPESALTTPTALWLYLKSKLARWVDKAGGAHKRGKGAKV